MSGIKAFTSVGSTNCLVASEIEGVVNNCMECCKAQYPRPQPLLSSKLPDLPWQKIGTDLFTWKGADYLLIAISR